MIKNTLILFGIICLVASTSFAEGRSRRGKARKAEHKCTKIVDATEKEKCLQEVEKKYNKKIDRKKTSDNK